VRATAEQAAAIADRSGSRLLSANAGSGKTAVMVERFVGAVAEDGVSPGAILAITFTEKAAAELRERIRRRFTELGRTEDARAAEGAWIGTIHGFCARVLRTQPVAAGLDPRFVVLEEAAAARVAAVAFERALEAWVAERGDAAVDLAATYGDEILRGMTTGIHAELRSAGQTRPRLPDPGAAPDTAPARVALLAAAERAAEEVGAATPGKRVNEALDALGRCRGLVEGVPLPPGLADLDVGTGAVALKTPACDAYREALAAYRDACAAHHAVPVVELLDALLGHFGAAYAAAKHARAGIDFDDLELCVRDLFVADPQAAQRWRDRFALMMVDEFQDTNRVQLELLRALEDDNLFAVGDEFQSIYGFRHADVAIFRERRAALGPEGNRRLTANFRSAPEILAVINHAFGPELGPAFNPLTPGEDDGELRLFAVGGDGAPATELLVTGCRGWEEHEDALGLGLPGTSPERRAEARLVAQRLREEADAGRAYGDMVVLVRTTASLGLFEQALEEAGLPTYVVGGRGYWGQEQVRDGLAYLRTLANPLDEEALYAVLASPFCGAGADALVLLAEAGRACGEGAWAALRGTLPPDVPPDDADRLRAFARFLATERPRAARLPVEVLLERAVAATGYDLAVLARAGGDRRLANLRKLMRLAREYEAAEGRDLRGFATYAAAQDLAQAREGEAALEAEDLDAVRLMTIHRAKGLEFKVVCIADLGKPGNASHPALLVARERVGLQLRTSAGGKGVPALAHAALRRDREDAEAQEERRLLYVAATRAEERLIVSGTTDLARPPAARHGGAPFAWLLGALTRGHALDPARPDRVLDAGGRLRVRINAPDTLGEVLRAPAPSAPGPAAPAPPAAAAAPALAAAPAPAPARPAPRRLSYSQLSEHARCGYRFYLERVLGLAAVDPPAAETPEPQRLDGRLRGSLAHVLLEELDFARPVPPDAERVRALATRRGTALRDEEVEDIRGLVAAFARSPLCARLARARDVRIEAPFAFALDVPDLGPLVTGFVDVLATEPDGTVLVVDYKSDRLDGADPQEAVERDYATQRRVYALAALRAGAPRAEVAYAFLERPEEPVSAVFTDPGELTAELARTAHGVLHEDWSVTADPHRELCGDCPGRARLCSHPEERTLRSYVTAAL
jgi:ATP-dependent helicase/nuclease subunit A